MQMGISQMQETKKPQQRAQLELPASKSQEQELIKSPEFGVGRGAPEWLSSSEMEVCTWAPPAPGQKWQNVTANTFRILIVNLTARPVKNYYLCLLKFNFLYQNFLKFVFSGYLYTENFTSQGFRPIREHTLLTIFLISANVHLFSSLQKISASLSGYFSVVSSRYSPIVRPTRGRSDIWWT